jgi:hypothetical protein
VEAGAPPPFESLDFLYMPASDVAAEVEHFTGALGARRVFAIEAFGARVAMVQLADGAPDVLLADHLDGERPVLVYRVASLGDAVAALADRGWEAGPEFGIPHGPCVELTTPAGHRIALYELTRPEARERLAGRRDF